MGEVYLLVFAGVTAVIRGITGTWAHPSVVTAAAWTIFLAMPMYLGLNDAPLATLAAGAIIVGALIASAIRVRPAEITPRTVRSSVGLRRFVFFGSAAGLIAGVLTLRSNGLSLTRAADLASLMLLANEATVMRYDGNLPIPLPAVILLGLTYGAALAAPFAAAGTRGLVKLALLAGPTLGAAAYAMATTARAGFLICFALTAAAWLVTSAIEQGGRPKVHMRAVAGAGAAGAAVAFLFIFFATVRIGGWRPSIIPMLADKVAVYVGGSIPAFDAWVRAARPSPRFGVETAAGIGQYIAPGTSGTAYGDRTDIGNGMSTNVYTMLRPLTEDFTFAGALFVFAMLSVLAAAAYRRATVHGSVLAAVLTAAWMGTVLFSSTTSILTFANVTLGLGVGGWLICRTVTMTVTAEVATDSARDTSTPVTG